MEWYQAIALLFSLIIGLMQGALCNECGNCMVFCPEDGDPAMIKPRLYTDPEVFASTKPTSAPCPKCLSGTRRRSNESS